MKRLIAVACLGFFGAGLFGVSPFGRTAFGQQGSGSPQKCAELSKLSLPHTTIVSAEITEARKLTLEDEKDRVLGSLPQFCRVVAQSHPSEDSQIKIEVWLPVKGWSGKFQGVGNGGFAGTVYYRDMAYAVLRGDATAGTDTGHAASGTDAGWALGHPEKIADFGWRGVHEMTLTGEAVTEAFYGSAPTKRYFASCSDGGREALMEAQRFPADYDGILAGAPAYNWTHLVSNGIPGVQALQRNPAAALSADKLPAIAAAVLAQCSPGSKTGYLEDPSQCHFDPAALLCRKSETEECLTQPQIDTLKTLYAGAHTRDGKRVDYGLMPGGELGRNGWGTWVTGSKEARSLGREFLGGYFANMVYQKADLDVMTLDIDEGLKAAVDKTGSDLDAVNPDLSAFSSRGGKLILYHGWNDPAIPALGTVDYFNAVTAAEGEEKTRAFARLFLVPGMQHCGGGPGLNQFGQDEPAWQADPEHNIYRALEAWVETGKAPEKVIAAHIALQFDKPKVIFTRPICAYPQEAAYSGSGNRKSADSYVCSAKK